MLYSMYPLVGDRRVRVGRLGERKDTLLNEFPVLPPVNRPTTWLALKGFFIWSGS